MGICSPGSLPLYTVMFDAMLLSDLANKFSLSISLPNTSKMADGRQMKNRKIALMQRYFHNGLTDFDDT